LLWGLGGSGLQGGADSDDHSRADHDVVGALKRPCERVEIGIAQPRLLAAMKDPHARVCGRSRVGNLSRSVGTTVVDDQNVGTGSRLSNPIDCRADHLRLVVGGDHNQRAGTAFGGHDD
jgi:hypothetical protein